MVWQYFADVVVILHYGFVAFVAGGALLLFRWQWIIWLQFPAVIWGAGAEFAHWHCPLTSAEHWLDVMGHVHPYAGDFIQHHLFPFLYSALLTVRAHIMLGVLLLLINAAIYGLWLRKTGLLRKVWGFVVH